MLTKVDTRLAAKHAGGSSPHQRYLGIWDEAVCHVVNLHAHEENSAVETIAFLAVHGVTWRFLIPWLCNSHFLHFQHVARGRSFLGEPACHGVLHPCRDSAAGLHACNQAMTMRSKYYMSGMSSSASQTQNTQYRLTQQYCGIVCQTCPTFVCLQCQYAVHRREIYWDPILCCHPSLMKVIPWKVSELFANYPSARQWWTVAC